MFTAAYGARNVMAHTVLGCRVVSPFLSKTKKGFVGNVTKEISVQKCKTKSTH